MKTSQQESAKVVIIGTGFGGIGMAIQLKKAGIDDFIILEKAQGVGGTWRDNTYPGAACDVQSHLYSFSFEPNSGWSRKFGGQPEIRAYIEHCVAKYGLAEHIRFGQCVEAASFDAATARWLVSCESGVVFHAQSLVTATGQLNQPAWPSLTGLDQFAGKLFHSSRWDHDYDLSDKTVAVIGTGASAIQFVPKIVPQVKKLTLFQRSGAWVIDKPDRPFKGWETSLFTHSKLADRAYRGLIYAKNESRALAFTRFGRLLDVMAWRSKWLMKKHIQDADKRRRLLPDYKIGCKRILMSNEWFPAIGRDNLDLVTDNIERVEADAIVTRDGRRFPVDAIILGTGFKSTDFLTPMTFTGLDGQDLNAAWRDGAEAYKGTSVAGFPNLFMLYGPNTNLSHNSIIYMLESQFRYVTNYLRRLERDNLGYMDVKPARQAAFNRKLQDSLTGSVWTQCRSWYVNDTGKITNNWPGFTFQFRHITSQLKAADYHATPASAVQEIVSIDAVAKTA